VYHKPVLLNESIEGLSVKPDGTYIDVTYGGGGHFAEILKRLKKGKLIAFEQDEEAIESGELRIENGEENWKKVEKNKVLFLKHNFRYIKNFLNYYGINKVDGIIADLGISSHQIDTAERGFSTRFEGILDMRMNKNRKLNAKKVVNEYTEEEMKRIFKTYGEIDNAGELAREIVFNRNKKQIETTLELKDAIKRIAPKANEIKYYSKVFQAIRIEVNDEIESLKEMLKRSAELLEKKGRLVVISYHSLEDRQVKNFIKAGNFEGEITKDFYGNPILPFKQITKKAVIPGKEEIRINSRARSAKLRIGEKY
jgi:16S rRNA (cytosine1402-N4)-methyltransferase